jgi:predicted membrane channel-forming protein YqfA (hemolysin III family)
MYSSALWLHSWLRWAVLLTGLVAWLRAISGKTARRPWTPQDDLWGLLLTISVDLQFVVGVVLYAFFSPIVRQGLRNFSVAMQINVVRFFTIEHVIGMIAGIALVHIARVKIRKASDADRKHRLAMVFYGIALVLMIISIPWPGLPVARPLFRP